MNNDLTEHSWIVLTDYFHALYLQNIGKKEVFLNSRNVYWSQMSKNVYDIDGKLSESMLIWRKMRFSEYW